MDAMQTILQPIEAEFAIFKKMQDDLAVNPNPLLREIILHVNKQRGKQMRPMRMLFKPLRILSAQVKEAQCHIAVFRIAGSMVQPHQADLDLLMAGDTLHLHEPVADMIRQSDADVQQLVLTGSFVQGNARLDHVSGAIKLMAFQQVGPAVFRLLHGEVGVEVSIRP